MKLTITIEDGEESNTIKVTSAWDPEVDVMESNTVILTPAQATGYMVLDLLLKDDIGKAYSTLYRENIFNKVTQQGEGKCQSDK